MIRRLVLACLLLPLGACMHPEAPRIVLDSRPVATSLLRCADEPTAPDARTARQRDLAPYVIALAEAGQDCRRKLGTVREIVEPAP